MTDNQHVPMTPPEEEDEFYECSYCGTEITSDQEHIVDGNDHYCDEECQEGQMMEEQEAESDNL